MAIILAFALKLNLFAASTVPAQKQSGDFQVFNYGREFQLSPVLDSTILLSGITLYGTEKILEKTIGAGKKSWNGEPGELLDRGSVKLWIDRSFMAPYSKSLDTVSSVLQYSCLLFPAVLFAAGPSEYLNIGVMYLEALSWAYGLKELAKITVSRPRPYMYFAGAPQNEIDYYDWDNSFFSGHTTASFCGATFASYLFCTYFPESPWKIPVVAGSYALAATVACLRVAGGNHFISDVVTGAIVGTACGFLIPFLHSFNATNETRNVALNVSPLCFSVGIKL